MTTTTYFANIPSPIGELLALSNGRELVGLYTPAQAPGKIAASFVAQRGQFGKLERQLDLYFQGRLTTFDLPVTFDGTPFQNRVWSALQRIPYGATTTYGDLARKLGNALAARAIGAANAKNPMAIVIPCHRVIGSDGGPTGYAGGLECKLWLLAHERAAKSRSQPPEQACSAR